MNSDSILRIALLQMHVGSDKEANIQKAISLINACVEENNVDLVCLPECFNSPYGTNFFAEYAEDVPNGETSTQMAEAARNLKICIVAGSIPERGSGGKLYNTSAIFGPDGQLIGKYRKSHLFDVDVPGKISFRESDTLSPGDELFSFSTKNSAGDLFTVGVGICYDIRFAEMALVYARKRNCDLLLYPGAFSTTTGPAHWEILARGRAVDTQCYVGVCGPAEDLSVSYVSHAESLVVSPWGKVVENAGKSERTIVVDISRAELNRVRSAIPIRKQLRHDMYMVNEVNS